MVNLKKDSRGITLIALVITIIVLLILAGVSIATLTGNNGLIKKAGEASKNTNKYKEVEQARLDIMAIITEKRGENPNKEEIKEVIRKYFVSVPEDLEDLTQEITTKEGNYNIRLSEVLEGVTVLKNVNTDILGVDFGNKVATTIEVGEDLTIGTERFRVLKTDKSTQIIAVPHYNITLVTPKENGGAYPEQTNETEGNTTAFSSDPYWVSGTDIDMTNSKNKIQKYITAYSTKLSGVTGGKVTARVARYSEMQDSAITLPEGTTVTKEQIRNPGPSSGYWLGSRQTYDNVTCYVVGDIRRLT